MAKVICFLVGDRIRRVQGYSLEQKNTFPDFILYAFNYWIPSSLQIQGWLPSFCNSSRSHLVVIPYFGNFVLYHL